MQEEGSQYGVSPKVTQYSRSHMLGEHLQQPQKQQRQLLQQHQQMKSGDGLPEEASPISSHHPSRPSAVNFEELVPGSGGFSYEEALAGEEAERGAAGNRWPRPETLALLKIRSEMDTAFRDATLKGPLWEDVSRKLAELRYIRSAKKCKEKFENVQKYYKRTKEGRAGRQDGKSYRFFSQLEALHNGDPVPPNNTIPAGIGTSNTGRIQSPAVAATSSAGQTMAPVTTPPATGLAQNLPGITPDLSVGGISFSSDSNPSSSDSDELEDPSRKRKRPESGSRKMMEFFESLMKQVLENQEAIQQRFLETIEKREQDRMMREEAWKRQEMARLNREQERLVQERAITASRDAAVIAFLQKITGQTIQIPAPVIIQAPPPFKQQEKQQAQQQQLQPPRHGLSMDIVSVQEHETATSFDPTSSRWPKSEVVALIKLRSGLDSRYQEAGPKGPLWGEISAGMGRLGYNRSAKRCKEKWENINKYFKKVKESNKKRPEDAKTCPYFHQLDALYKKKNLLIISSSNNNNNNNNTGLGNQSKQEQERNSDLLAIMPPLPETESKNTDTNNNNEGKNGGGSTVQVPTSNGGLPPSFFQSGGEDGNKPEGIVKELIKQRQPQPVMDDYDEPDSDNLEQDEEDDDAEEQKMAYKVQFQRQIPPSTGNAASFTAMVQ